MNPKWTRSEIIKSDLFTCLVLVFLYSATTFFKVLAKPLDSIFSCFSLMTEADIWNWLGMGSLGCPLPEFVCRGMPEERFGIHIFCVGVISLRRGFFLHAWRCYMDNGRQFKCKGRTAGSDLPSVLDTEPLVFRKQEFLNCDSWTTNGMGRLFWNGNARLVGLRSHLR